MSKALYLAGLVLLTCCCSTWGSNDCEKLGFTGLQTCNDCDNMAEYVKDADLVAECKACCVKEQQDDAKYTSVKLEVCPYRLNGLPQIQDFIAKHVGRYKGQLKVVRNMGSYPKLILTHKDTGAKISVRIDNWKVSTIHEFLQDKLEPLQATS